MKYLGDYAEDYATLNFKFSTHKADGTPITLAGSPVVSVYKANGTTQSTAGITLSVDFDSVTGLNNVLIDLSADAFYAVGNDYSVVITAGTVNGVSVVGTVVAHFSIENRANAAEITSIKGVTDKLDTAMELDGAVYRFTENALEEAPSSGSAPTVEQIRAEIDSNSTQLAAILEDTGTTIPALINSDSGAGTIQHTYTVTDSSDGMPIDGVEVWVSTDAAGVNVIASGHTNSSGIVIFMLDAGTYYFWRKLSGYNFTNPDTEIVA